MKSGLKEMNVTPLTSSVKVMRSYDYCHFEINLSRETLGTTHDEQLKSVDDLRKDAMRLADKAVKQYKIAKRDEEQRCSAISRTEYFKERIQKLHKKPESEWTESDKAANKTWDDANYHANRHGYDYEDDHEYDDAFGD